MSEEITNWDYLAKVPDHMTHYKAEFGVFASMWKKKVKVELLKQVPLTPNMVTVEVGCGSGFFGEIAKENGITITHGIDLTQELIDASRDKYDNVLLGKAEKLPLKNKTVDVIFMPEVIAYVNQKLTFYEANRVLKHGGYIIMTSSTKFKIEPLIHLFEIVKKYNVFYGIGFRQIVVVKKR